MKYAVIILVKNSSENIIILFVHQKLYNSREMSDMENGRINTRINSDIKIKAEKYLAEHGLTLSEFVRIAVTTVANNGLPNNWGIPSPEINQSILEMVDDLNDPKLKRANSLSELESLLNEWGYSYI